MRQGRGMPSSIKRAACSSAQCRWPAYRGDWQEVHAGVSLGNAHPVDNVHSLCQGPAYPQQTKNAHPFDNALPTYPLVVEIFSK